MGLEQLTISYTKHKRKKARVSVQQYGTQGSLCAVPMSDLFVTRFVCTDVILSIIFFLLMFKSVWDILCFPAKRVEFSFLLLPF